MPLNEHTKEIVTHTNTQAKNKNIVITASCFYLKKKIMRQKNKQKNQTKSKAANKN